jgi:hypothetical protein
LDADVGDSNTIPAYVPSDVSVAQIAGNSMMRDILVEEIAAMGRSRPAYNIKRNN